MNSFKQALIQLKNDWLNALLLGCFSAAYVIAARFVPFISAFLLSLGLILLQAYARYFLQFKSWKKPPFKKDTFLSLFIISIVLIPTSALFGSATGILESPQTLIQSVPMALFLLILAIYFYGIFYHALQLRLDTNVSIAKAIDVAALVSFKNLKLYLVMCFYLALLFVLAGLTYGAGLVLALPLLFFANSFAYDSLKEQLHEKVGSK